VQFARAEYRGSLGYDIDGDCDRVGEGSR